MHATDRLQALNTTTVTSENGRGGIATVQTYRFSTLVVLVVAAQPPLPPSPASSPPSLEITAPVSTSGSGSSKELLIVAAVVSSLAVRRAV